MPEYNYGYNSAVKNAIDYLHAEWQYKAVGFTGEWRLAPGPCRCSKQVVTTLKIVPLFESVNIPFVQQFLDPEGRLQPNESMVGAATAMLDELAGGLLSWAGSGRRRPRSASEPPAAAPWHPPSGAGPGCSLRDTRVAAEDGRGRE